MRGHIQCAHERPPEDPFDVQSLRDAALELQRHTAVQRYSVEAENFESIHNHSAYARIASPA